MLYGDSKSGTFASGTVGLDTASIAGIAMPQHPFALIEDTNNLLVQFGATGIFGLSFPAARCERIIFQCEKALLLMPCSFTVLFRLLF